MGYPVDSNINPTVEELYDDLYLDYFYEKTKIAFPSIYGDNKGYQILIRLMAWAVARSYQQPQILRYLYNPDLVIDTLLPRLADTLGFTYPLEYPLPWLRVLIKYIQKIRRSRGTINSIKQLIRLLEISEEEVLSLSFTDYASVEVDEPEPGFLMIHYNRISDFEFANEMLRLVMPAGYTWRLESSIDTPNELFVYRNRADLIKFNELMYYAGDSVRTEHCTFIERATFIKTNQPI